MERKRSGSVERLNSARSMERKGSAVSIDRQKSVPMERQRSAVSVDRQKSVTMERRGSAVSIDRQKSVPMERQLSARSIDQQKPATMERRGSAVSIDRQKSVTMERQISARSIDRQKPVTMERRGSTMSVDRQKSMSTDRQKSVPMERQRSGMGTRSNSMGNLKSTGVNRSNSKLNKVQSQGKQLEYPCMLCESEGKNIEATNFCSDCAENLCADCVKQHQKFPAMRNHRILGKADRRKGESAPTTNPLECDLHPGKQVEMYCEDHNEIWCGACIAVHHRRCKNIMMLEKAAKGILQSDEFKDVRDNIKLVRKDIVVLRKKADSNLTKLEKQKTTVLKKIQLYRQKVNQAIDKLEEATVKELEQAVERAKHFTEDDKKLYNDMVSAMDTILNMVIKTKGSDLGEPAIFVGVKRAKQKIIEGKRVLQFTKNSTVKEALRFIPDNRIVEWLKSLEQLGTFAHQQKSYAGVQIGKYTVKDATDSSQCDIFGCDVLPDGRLLLADWDNQNVKLLDTNYNIIGQCGVPGSPVDICCINPEEAVASLTLQKKLQFIHIDATVKATRTLAMDENCRGVAYHDGQIFVLCGGFKNETDGCIRVFSVTGEPVRIIKTNNLNQRIFASPIALAIDAGGVYHVTDGQRGVITMTSSNDVVSIISCKDVSWPCGICMDTDGNALICNGKSSSIIQMSTLSKFTTVLRYEDGVKNPHSVCFDQNNSRLIVTNKSNSITVFQLQARDMTEVAMDVKPTVPKKEFPVISLEKPENQNDGGAKKSDDKTSNKKNEKEPKEKAVKETKGKTDTKEEEDKNKEISNKEESDIQQSSSFRAMADKILKSQHFLKAIQEVSKANTAPENGPKALQKAGKQPTKKPAGKKVDPSAPNQSSVKQSKDETPQSQQSTDNSKEKSENERPHEKVDSRIQKEWLVPKRSETKPIREGISKPGNRPLTASTDSGISKSMSLSSEGKTKVTNQPSAINAMTSRSKEKTQLMTTRTTSSLSKSLKPEPSNKGKTLTKTTMEKTNTDTNEKGTKNTDNEKSEKKLNEPEISEQADNQYSEQKEKLTKQNQQVNASMQNLRNKKIAPSPRPPTRESSSLRSIKQTGRSVRKT